MEPLSEDFRGWLEAERRWGRRAIDVLDVHRARAERRDGSGIERFAARIDVVGYNGAVARWARGLADGLAAAGVSNPRLDPPSISVDSGAREFAAVRDFIEAWIHRIDLVLEPEQGSTH